MGTGAEDVGLHREVGQKVMLRGSDVISSWGQISTQEATGGGGFSREPTPTPAA